MISRSILIIAFSMLAGEPRLTLQVRPQVMLTGSDIQITVRVAKHEDNRRLVVVWDSIKSGAGQSQVSLEGAEAPVIHDFRLRDQPPDTYEILAILYDWRGKVVARESATIQGAQQEGK